MVELRQMGGAPAHQPKAPNAVAGRDGAFSLMVLGLGPTAPGIAGVVVATGGAVFDALAPWLTGTSLLNFLGNAKTPEKVATAWSPGVHGRLLAVKRRVDPHNVFRMGHALSGQ